MPQTNHSPNKNSNVAAAVASREKGAPKMRLNSAEKVFPANVAGRAHASARSSALK